MIDIMFEEADRMIRDVTRRFVDEEMIPLEQQILRADAEENWVIDDGPGHRSALTHEQRDELQAKAREIGLHDLNRSEEDGGAGVTEMQRTLISEQMGRTIVPLNLGGEAPNISMLEELATPQQVED